MPTAERNAVLKFKVEGGKQLKDQISEINAQMKTLKLQTAQTKNEFIGQENTTEALRKKCTLLWEQLSKLEEKQRRQSEYIDGVRKSMDALNTEYKQQEEAIEHYTQQEAMAITQHGKASAQYRQAHTELEKLRKSHETTATAITKANKELATAETAYLKTTEEVYKLGTELDKNLGYYQESIEAVDGCATSIDRYGREVQTASSKTSTAVSAMATAIINSGVKQGINEITQAIKECVAASTDFESAMTGIQKTTTLTGAELAAMGEDLKALSTTIPMSASDIAALVEKGGQLGIQDANLKSFAETIAALSVSTNILGDEGSSNLARFANIMGSSQDVFDRMGSSIVDLGNNFATTESEILAMAMNLAGAGRQAGLSEADILGIATAISSVGIESGKGGTAFSKMLNQMTVAAKSSTGDMTKWADVVGMTSDEFKDLYNNDTIAAVNLFYSSLGNGSETAIELLSEMGVSEVRLRDTMLRLAASSDLLTSAVDMSNRAWNENTALMHEANLFYGTTESQTKTLQNAFQNLKIAVGDSLNPSLNAAKGTLKDMLIPMTQFVENNQGLVKIITVVVASLSTMAVTFTTLTAAAAAFKTIQEALNVTLLASPYTYVAVALGALVALLGLVTFSLGNTSAAAEDYSANFNRVAESMDYAISSFDKSIESIAATRAVTDDYLDTLDRLSSKSKMSAEEQELYNDTIEKLQQLYPDLKVEIDETTGLIIGGTDALREQIDAWEENAIAAAKMEYIKQMASDLTKAEVELKATEIELGKARDALTAKTKEREDAEQNLLAVFNITGKTYADLTVAERELIEATAENDETVRALYDAWVTLSGEEGQLREKVDDLTDAYGDQAAGLGEMKDKYDIAKEAVGELADTVGATVDEIRGVDWEGLGEDTVQGLIDGANRKRALLASTYAALGATAQSAYKNTNQIRSPSKVFAQFGEYDVEGIITGADRRKEDLERTYASLAEKTQLSYTNAAQNINNSTVNAPMTINTTDLSEEKIEFIVGLVNRRLAHV